MKVDDAVEQGAGDRGGSVGVAGRNKVGVLGEAVDHCQHDRLAAHLRQPLDEIHRDVRPDLGWHVEGLM